MRNRQMSILGVLCLALIVTAVGCSKPPQEQLDASQTAVAGAESAQAPTYAKAEWEAAQSAVNAMNAEVETQNGKFALFRSYQHARELAEQAATAANVARDAAVAGKARAKADAEQAMEAANAAIAKAQGLVAELGACKRKPKGFAADMEAMQGRLDALTSQAGEIGGQIASEDYFGAKSRAEGVTQQADTLAADLEQAKTKLRC